MNREALQRAFSEAKAAGDFQNAYLIEQQLKDAPVDFELSKMVKNIPGSAYKYGKDMYDAVTSPVDTAKGLWSLAEATGNKIGRNVAELVHGQEFEEMPEHSEAAADAVGQAAKDRYGSVNAIKQTLMDDPVGALADASGVMMATKVPALAKIGAAAEPVNLLTKGIQGAAKAAIPEKLPSNLYQSAAKFSTTLKPAERSAIVRTALEEGIMPTAKGVVKIENRLDALNTVMDELITDATARGVTIPVKEVERYLQDLRRTKGGVRLGAEKDLEAIDRIASEFDQHMWNLNKTSLTPDELQQFKVDAYKSINWDAKRMTGTPIKEDTYKAMARAAKDAVAGVIPEANEINKKLGSLYELQPHLTRAANRIDNRNMLSINTPLNVGAGGMLGDVFGSGGAGVTAGLITSALGNPKMKARVAIALNKIKQKDLKWLEANQGLAETRIALALIGRGEETLNDQPASQ